MNPQSCHRSCRPRPKRSRNSRRSRPIRLGSSARRPTCPTSAANPATMAQLVMRLSQPICVDRPPMISLHAHTRLEDNVPRFLCTALIAAASISAAPALAQDSYPNKPIKIVLPVPPGSALDIATRAIGEQLSVRWGQQVLIEARPGAGRPVARGAVASAPPDGYTLLGGPASLFTILPAQKDKLPIDVSSLCIDPVHLKNMLR